MKAKSILFLGMAAMVLAATLSSCAGDPRKNCNHPDHGRYMAEKMAKKRGI